LAFGHFPFAFISRQLKIVFNALVLAKCKTNKSERHQDGSSYHQPMRILHCGEHRLFPPSDNLDTLFLRRLEDDP
jgi:hypothetical protein